MSNGAWTDQENDLIVADYFAMLADDVSGRLYNKAEHRRGLLPLLNERSAGSVEFKHQNISAVLKAAGAEGRKIIVQAADGYSPEFTGADVAQDKMILAVLADGKPLAMGGRGPLWLFGPPGSFSGQEADEGFAFEVIRIDAQ